MQALDVGDVQRICSGQSIPDASIALKELIENALDACATQIVIRFEEYGKTTIEVLDNGTGIPSENHATLAQKNHTSKIALFEDIKTVQSFGFRYVFSFILRVKNNAIKTAAKHSVPSVNWL